MAKKSTPSGSERADDSMGGTDRIVSEQGAGQPVPAQPATPSWFLRTCQRLNITDPDTIVTFTHGPHSVTVKLANGAEYCLMKASF